MASAAVDVLRGRVVVDIPCFDDVFTADSGLAGISTFTSLTFSDSSSSGEQNLHEQLLVSPDSSVASHSR